MDINSAAQKIADAARSDIGNLVTNFVADALKGTPAAPTTPVATVTAATTTAAPTKKTAAPAKKTAAPKAKPEGTAKAAGGGAKRDPAVIETMKAAFLAYVTANPGQGIEVIGKAISFNTKELALPIKKLSAEGKIQTVGERRSMKYLPK